MGDYTEKEKIELISEYINHNSYKAACNKFHENHPNKRKPQYLYCKKLFDNLRDYGTIKGKSKPSKAMKEAIEPLVVKALEKYFDHSTASLQIVAKAFQTTEYNICQILKHKKIDNKGGSPTIKLSNDKLVTKIFALIAKDRLPAGRHWMIITEKEKKRFFSERAISSESSSIVYVTPKALLPKLKRTPKLCHFSNKHKLDSVLERLPLDQNVLKQKRQYKPAYRSPTKFESQENVDFDSFIKKGKSSLLRSIRCGDIKGAEQENDENTIAVKKEI